MKTSMRADKKRLEDRARTAYWRRSGVLPNHLGRRDENRCDGGCSRTMRDIKTQEVVIWN